MSRPAIALLAAPPARAALELERSLLSAGQPAARLQPPPLRALERRLARRGYEQGSSRILTSVALLAAQRPQLVHALGAPEGFAAACWSQRSGRPVVFSPTCLPPREWLVARRTRLRYVLAACSQAAACTAFSQRVADAMMWSLGVEARVVAPGVDLARFMPGHPRATSPVVALPGGRLDQGTAAALRLLRHRVPELRVARSSSPAELGRAWLTLVADHSADSQVTVLQSLASGTPVVASLEGPAAEIADQPPIGSLFGEAHPQAICASLLDGLELARDPTTAQRCRARAEQFPAGRWARAHLDIYRQLGS